MISVIIPTLNEETCIQKTLETLLAATGSFEIVVADGQSEDRTASIASRYCQTITSARGRAQQMNAGAQVAHGEILLFLHADVVFPRTGFQSLQLAMEDRQVIGGNFDLIFDGDGGVPRIFSLINRWRRPFGIFYGDSGIFVRREIYDEMLGYRALPLMEDYDFARRLVKRGKTAFVRNPLIVSSRRWEEHGVWRTMSLWFFLHTFYLAGVPARYLAPFYPPIRRRLTSHEEDFSPAEKGVTR